MQKSSLIILSIFLLFMTGISLVAVYAYATAETSTCTCTSSSEKVL